MKFLQSFLAPFASFILVCGIYYNALLFIIIGAVALVIIIAIIFLLKRSSLKKAIAAMDEFYSKLKSTGERIPVDLDNCEIKDSSYSQDIIDERMTRFSTINLDYGKVIRKEQVVQSLLIFNYDGAYGKEIFMDGFPFSAENLKLYLIRNAITLYVDRNNRKSYFFDIKEN